jgi:hypothetical protein
MLVSINETSFAKNTRTGYEPGRSGKLLVSKKRYPLIPTESAVAAIQSCGRQQIDERKESFNTSSPIDAVSGFTSPYSCVPVVGHVAFYHAKNRSVATQLRLALSCSSRTTIIPGSSKLKVLHIVMCRFYAHR